jgi:hypothetical protein
LMPDFEEEGEPGAFGISVLQLSPVKSISNFKCLP